jgi:hypothetical protein
MHGGGRFDDPFMIPEPSPRGERPQRRQAIIALLAIGLLVLIVSILVVLD